jgi:hypothetical protein
MNLFVLVYDRRRRELADIQQFEPGQYDLANRRLSEVEFSNPDLEVVLLEAGSVAELRLTHARYFIDLGGQLIGAAS